jgi:hypothetical protein
LAAEKIDVGVDISAAFENGSVGGIAAEFEEF